jgi:hypothetical protein
MDGFLPEKGVKDARELLYKTWWQHSTRRRRKAHSKVNEDV